MQGIFITFEGIDACGKSVQIKLLEAKLQEHGKSVLVIREPGGTTLSENIRDVVLKQRGTVVDSRSEFLLYSAARAQLTSEKIVPALEAGRVVLCDRFYDSSTAYQGYGREIDLESIHAVNQFATHELIPDITFLLNIDIETMKSRQKTSEASLDRIESESDAFFNRVRNGYLELAQKYSERFQKIDGTQAIDTIANQIWNYSWSYLQGV